MNTTIPMIKLIEAMNEQPIAFNKHYVFIGCGINGALMLSQLVYWTSRTKDNDGWIFKTHSDWTMETGLTRKEQETARKILKNLGFISERKKGVPCKVFFRVERENLYKALIEYSETLTPSQLRKSGQPDAQIVHSSCADQDNLMRKSGQLDAQISPSNTENTTENTTESISAVAPSKTQKFSAKEILIKNGVSEQTISEYTNLRNKKKKPITENVLKLVFGQAKQACISNERAFQIIVVRGWETFKAAWNWQETNAELDQLENPQPVQTEQQNPSLINLPSKPKGFLGGSNV
ncbi:DNA-binding protein [Acinetobacter kyonggiensis]|uniref:Uncharacterized protein n=1 Tax=Acinetobacter kyonggiensis TaxID=595670 RepID=A0A1H3L812_9GAMM|nr:DNA-binding protein [Acinetobacter kyonggiensis]SDY60064.1 hypothetical protein SAMN05421643_11630 [Acinetobacter kyonggiensis]